MPSIHTLFSKYKQNLSMLQELGYVKGDAEFICPICLQEFTHKDIYKLSKEDAPLASLGGKQICVTCKDCNNRCGHEIDVYLSNYVDYIERSKMYSGTSGKIAIKFKSDEVFGQLKMSGNGRGTVRVPMTDKGNNPDKAKDFTSTTRKDDYLWIRNVYYVQDTFKAQVAMLKTAYIILYANLGYSFILDKSYDTVREQILNADKQVISKIWARMIQIQLSDGIYTIEEAGCKGYYVIYTLQKSTKHRVMVYLPFPAVQYSSIFSQHMSSDDTVVIPVKRIPEMDYLNDKKAIGYLNKLVYGK